MSAWFVGGRIWPLWVENDVKPISSINKSIQGSQVIGTGLSAGWQLSLWRHIWSAILNDIWSEFTFPRQDGRHFPDDIFKWIFLNEIIIISIRISLKFVPSGPIKNIPALVQIMAWRRPGGKPLSGPMMVSLLTHICVTRPQWVNSLASSDAIYCRDIELGLHWFE